MRDTNHMKKALNEYDIYAEFIALNRLRVQGSKSNQMSVRPRLRLGISLCESGSPHRVMQNHEAIHEGSR
jgi:hypothetical protein